MRNSAFRFGLLAIFLVSACHLPLFAFVEPPSEASSQPPNQKKLAVVVVFDQMRGDYLSKWENLFDKDGFGRMLRDGAWYQNCHYPYAVTLTAAGHASISTGCSPFQHGIIANDWYDRDRRAGVGSVSADRFRLVPSTMSKNADGPAPLRLKQPTVGDALSKMGESKAKVVSLSLKDRAAILLAALRATAVYWFHTARGWFVTSTYYRDSLHSWVDEFNKERPAEKYFGKDWNKLRPDLDYSKYCGPDDVSLEGIGHKQGRAFPHPTTGGLEKPGNAFYEAVKHSPFGNEMLLELAKRAIDAEKLGQHEDARDLLCISFSSNDLVGHCWGPDSQEVLDITLRSDLIMKELLSYLDAKVGKDRYVVVVSADHGVVSIPALAQEQGINAGRVAPNLFTSQASAFLQKTFGNAGKELPWIEKSSAGWIYLNHATLKEAGVPTAKAEEALVDWLQKQPGIHSAYSRSQMEKTDFAKGSFGDMVRHSFHPDCRGDVAAVVKPNFMVSGALTDKNSPAYRTTHGSPHPYDTHVPLLVFGGGIKAGPRQERVTPMAAAAIVAKSLGINPPAAACPAPEGLFK
jgi:predicted AlkP superfamily pyrophosphatase or phosphodiesterase